MNFLLTVKPKNVNSKPLFDVINEFMEEAATKIGIDWRVPDHRVTFVDLAEDWLREQFELNMITQFNVICDQRNNSTDSESKGKYHAQITYKQRNCINTTTISYEMTDENKLLGSGLARLLTKSRP